MVWFGVFFNWLWNCDYSLLELQGVVKDYENLCGSVLLSEFEREYYHKRIMRSPIKLYVSQNDLKKKSV